jgi:hypothetical protein
MDCIKKNNHMDKKFNIITIHHNGNNPAHPTNKNKSPQFSRTQPRASCIYLKQHEHRSMVTNEKNNPLAREYDIVYGMI